MMKTIFFEKNGAPIEIHDITLKEEESGEERFSIEISCIDSESAETLSKQLITHRHLASMDAKLFNHQQYHVQYSEKTVTVTGDIDAALMIIEDYKDIDVDLIEEIKENSEVKDLRKNVEQWSRIKFGPTPEKSVKEDEMEVLAVQEKRGIEKLAVNDVSDQHSTGEEERGKMIQSLSQQLKDAGCQDSSEKAQEKNEGALVVSKGMGQL